MTKTGSINIPRASPKDVRNAGRSRAKKPPTRGPARTAYNRGQILYRARRGARVASRPAGGGLRPRPGRGGGGTCSCTTPAGRTSSRRCSAGIKPCRRAIPLVLCARADRRRRGGRAGRAPSLLGLRSRASHPRWRRANTVVRDRPSRQPSPLAGLDFAEVLGRRRRPRPASSTSCPGGARNSRWHSAVTANLNAVVDAAGEAWAIR